MVTEVVVLLTCTPCNSPTMALCETVHAHGTAWHTVWHKEELDGWHRVKHWMAQRSTRGGAGWYSVGHGMAHSVVEGVTME